MWLKFPINRSFYYNFRVFKIVATLAMRFLRYLRFNGNQALYASCRRLRFDGKFLSHNLKVYHFYLFFLSIRCVCMYGQQIFYDKFLVFWLPRQLYYYVITTILSSTFLIFFYSHSHFRNFLCVTWGKDRRCKMVKFSISLWITGHEIIANHGSRKYPCPPQPRTQGICSWELNSKYPGYEVAPPPLPSFHI